MMEGRLHGLEHQLSLRVYYEDTDAAGVVYHASYLRFAERGRCEFLRTLGVAQGTLRRDHGLIFAVARVELDYLAPIRLDDRIELHTRLDTLGRASLSTFQQFWVNGTLCAELIARIVALSTESGRPLRLPHGLRHLIAPFCGDGPLSVE